LVTGHRYTLDEAQALLPAARTRIAEAAALVADLQRLLQQLRAGTAPASTIDQAAMLEAGVDVAFGWFEEQGVQVKSLSPALLDFPARAIRDGEAIDVLLCWRDDESAIAYYHSPEGGYGVREPVALLDRV
jgi:hypothetical protein